MRMILICDTLTQVCRSSPFASEFMVRALVGGALVAAVCAIVGTWVVVRGMAFLGEAISHGMLPGVAVATPAFRRCGEPPSAVRR